MKKVRSNCEHCGSEDIYYHVIMIVKGTGTMTKDGFIDEFTEPDDKPLKYKITGYSCMNCPYDGDEGWGE